jgi:hypothetical protein
MTRTGATQANASQARAGSRAPPAPVATGGASGWGEGPPECLSAALHNIERYLADETLAAHQIEELEPALVHAAPRLQDGELQHRNAMAARARVVHPRAARQPPLDRRCELYHVGGAPCVVWRVLIARRGLGATY